MPKNFRSVKLKERIVQFHYYTEEKAPNNFVYFRLVGHLHQVNIALFQIASTITIVRKLLLNIEFTYELNVSK